MKVILASQSPRRKILMDSLKIPYEIIISNAEEIIEPNLSLEEQSKRISHIKAEMVYNKTKELGDRIIIGADTIVFKDGKIYGKPKTKQEAIQYFREFSNSKVQVVTSLSIMIFQNENFKEYQDIDKVEIEFAKLDDIDIELCLEKENVYDKAGGFFVTGFSGVFIKNINGTIMSAMGLPLNKVYEILKKYNIFSK